MDHLELIFLFDAGTTPCRLKVTCMWRFLPHRSSLKEMTSMLPPAWIMVLRDL